MSGAVARGLAFLAAEQNDAGFWEDWDLPVGSSRLWTTAYVGWRLASSGRAPASMLERAADWLEANELDGGGWGYAASTGADADSTALGILFLGAIGRDAPGSALRRLLGFAREDGGFATYGFEQSFGAWTASQVEVTATAALALRMAGVAQDVVMRAEAFLSGRRRADGLWDSYWWTSPFYATEVSARLLGNQARRQAAAASANIRASNSFEEALRGLILCHADGCLAGAQLPDGSWPSAAVLRLTRRDIFQPQTGQDAGACFRDPRRVFTSATVVDALSRYSPGQ